MDLKYAEILEHAIHEIYNHNTSGLSFEELYRDVYNMVFHEYGRKLCSSLVTTTTGHLREMAKTIEAAQGSLFLERVEDGWIITKRYR
jgi:cullin 3